MLCGLPPTPEARIVDSEEATVDRQGNNSVNTSPSFLPLRPSHKLVEIVRLPDTKHL
jgi:hypothetical protein